MYGPDAVSEVALARRLIARLAGAVELVADRNFGVFAMAYAAVGLGHGVLFRLMDKRFGRMLAAARDAGGAEERGPGDWRIAWTPSRWDRGSDPPRRRRRRPAGRGRGRA